ncbi:hypothetical protein [Streptomyces melanosporofaciens]|uniref:hypothetical protein n=1 Tax=Streptomyces melanosporofaciens TaxID=67327 RepID=UPI000AF9B51F
MLLQLAYLGMTDAFAMLRLLPVSDRDTDVEIPTLRHQLMVVARQLGKDRVRCTPSDRAFLAGGAAASAATGDAARAASGGTPRHGAAPASRPHGAVDANLPA